jgi:hypothetical protein
MIGDGGPWPRAYEAVHLLSIAKVTRQVSNLMGVLWLNSDRPDVLLRRQRLLTDQLAFVPGLTVLIGFHDRLLFVLSKVADFFA